MLSLPACIQSKRGIKYDCCSRPLSSKKIPKLTQKDRKTAKLAINPTAFLGSEFLPKPLIMNPAKGNKGTNQTKFIMYRKILNLINIKALPFQPVQNIDIG